ncbi:MAG: ImmA/IrrE family metallo-endopeptidase [Bacteroidales bacterium]|nr:ImmA/IrrE family metallo-endopeptidase [Bacteroidales bacterium]
MKPKRYTWPEIRKLAEDFRAIYVDPPDKIPVPIEEIVEFSLCLEIVPKDRLKSTIDVDGFLSNDLKTIYIDGKIYSDERYSNRLRFTLAHEVAHYILHEEIIKKSQFRTIEDWIHFREEMSEEDLNWFEQQAYEFSGRLLIPKEHLIKALEEQREKIETFKSLVSNDNDERIIDTISNVICDKFGVSSNVIYRRIRSEKLWDELKF